MILINAFLPYLDIFYSRSRSFVRRKSFDGKLFTAGAGEKGFSQRRKSIFCFVDPSFSSRIDPFRWNKKKPMTKEKNLINACEK